MVAHGASSLLVKLLDMKMWDGSLIKYYISILVCPAARIFSEILISHSLRIFWIHRILLHGGKPWPKKEFEFASRWGKLESSLFLLLPTSRRQYHHRLHRLLRQFFFTHPPLPEVWPRSQNFWSQKLTIFLTPHSLINRVKSPLWMQTGSILYLSPLCVVLLLSPLS